MKIFLTLLCLLIADFLYAQQNSASPKNVSTVPVQGASVSGKSTVKKVHYVDKRKRGIQGASKSKSCSQIHKKSDSVKEESKNKVLSK